MAPVTIKPSRPIHFFLRIAASFSCFLASGFFFWAFHARYLKWDFNEEGRHYDAAEHIVYTTAGFVWIIPAIGFLLVALVLIWGAIKRQGKR